jgi:type IV pilus assembly protein PilM
MGRYLVSFDIGSKNIHMVNGRYHKGSFDIQKTVVKSTPAGVINDGKIENSGILRDTIKGLMIENKIKDKKAIFTIQSTSVITRDITLPTVKHGELDSMVKYEIEQFLPIVATEYVIEYALIEELVIDGITQSRLQVAAMPKYLVDNYFNLLKEAGLKPVALDIHSNTVAKFFSNPMSINNRRYSTEKTIAFIDLGYRNISVHILSNGKLDFSRIIAHGARDLDTDISVEQGLSLEQAEAKKIKESNLEIRNNEMFDPVSFQGLVRSKIDVWLSEIQKIFQYYISRKTGNRVEGIYLYGGSSKIKGLPDYVEQTLNISTEKINSLSAVNTGKDLKDFSPEDFINAMGGLIRYE